MDNLILSSTNLVVLIPVSYAIQQSHYIQAAALFFAGAASFWYHLIEHFKHDMTGFIPKYRTVRHHKLFIGLDRIGAVSAIASHIPLLKEYVERKKDYTLIGMGIAAIILEVFTDLMNQMRFWGLNKQQRVYLKWLFVFLHGIWHISAFALAIPLHQKF